MSNSLRDFVISHDDRVYESVVVPEWDGRTVWLRSPDSAARDAFEAGLIVERKKRKANGKMKTERKAELDNIRAKLVVLCVCEDKGNPTLVFKPDDAAMLGAKNAAAVDRIYEVAQRLAGISEEDIDELAGN